MDFIAPQRHPPKPAHHYRGLHYSEKWVARAQSELFKVARNSKTIIVTQFEVATIILISLYLLQNGREGRRKQNCLHEARIGFNPLSRIFCYCSHRFSHHCREIACHKSSVSNGFNKGKWGKHFISKGLIRGLILFNSCVLTPFKTISFYDKQLRENGGRNDANSNIICEKPHPVSHNPEVAHPYRTQVIP